MKQQPEPITKEELDRVFTFLGDRTSPITTSGHLSDDDYVDFALEDVSTSDTARIDTHLMGCEECAKGMENLVEGAQVWETESGKRTLAARKERLITDILASPFEGAASQWQEMVRQLETFLGSFSLEPAALRFATDTVETGRSDDERFSYSIDHRGDVKITLSCFDNSETGREIDELVGKLLELRGIVDQDGPEETIRDEHGVAVDWAKGEIERVSDGELSVEFLIPRYYQDRYREIHLRLSVLDVTL